MRRIFYFHGLQSKQGGQKIDFLTRQSLVHAPVMVYKEPSTWPETLKKVQNAVPDIVMGSSMGGLMSIYSAYNLQCTILAFNPAIDRIHEYIDGWVCDGTKQKADIYVILGKNDTDVDPKHTVSYFQANKIKANITWLDFQHRVPFDILTDQFEKLVNILDKNVVKTFQK